MDQQQSHVLSQISKKPMFKGLLLIFLTFIGVQSVREVEIYDLNFAYKSLLDAQSLCRHKRAVVFSDKPVYKPGETAYFSVYYYNLLTKNPLANCKDNMYGSISIYDVNDKFITSIQPEFQKNNNGSGETELEDYSAIFYSYEIPRDQAGGVLTARLSEKGNDEVRFFIMAFNNRKVALVGDWNADFAKTGDLLKGKLTFKVLTTENTGAAKTKIIYRWLDLSGQELLTSQEDMIDNSYLINYRVPPFDNGLVFVAEAITGNYKAGYKKEFLKPNFKEVIVEFTIGTGKLVQDLSNKIYFQAFATKKKDAPVTIKDAKVIRTINNKADTIIPSLSSDSHGKGMFEVIVTSTDVEKHAKFELEVRYDEENTVRYQIFDLTKVEFSPILMQLSKLYYESNQKISVDLQTYEFNGKVSIVVQNKSHILTIRNIYFNDVARNLKAQKKTQMITISDLTVQGGVLTVQVYISKAKEQKINPKPLPATDDGSKPATEINQEALVEMKRDAILVKPRRPIPAPEHKPPKILKFKGKIIQESEVFVEPPQIVGAKIEFNKPSYLPGDKVEFGIYQNIYCKRCEPAYADNMKVVIMVTDESAFLEVEKSRESSSLFTKVFLEREVLSGSHFLRSPEKYIDHIFNHKSKLTKDEITQRRRNVEYLLGNASQRKFMFDPDKLEEYIQQSYNEKYNDVRTLYEYLLPSDNGGIIQPVFARPMMAFAKNMAVPMAEPMLMMEAADMAAPPKVLGAGGAAPAESSQQQFDNTDPVTGTEEEMLKRDTIYHNIEFLKGKGIIGHFTVPERVTNFMFRVFMVTPAGVYGYDEKRFSVRKPINISADIPLFLYKDEVLKIPVVIENNQGNLAEVYFKKPSQMTKTIQARSSISEIFTLDGKSLPMSIEIQDKDGKILSNYKVAPKIVNPGILAIDGASGFIETQNAATVLSYSSSYNKELVHGNNKLEVCYRNGILSMILDTIREFNRIPTGCFEQASTTTFPIIIALKVLKHLPQTPEIKKLTEELVENLKKGIQLLLKYECKTGGFEWFGSDPGHSTLTAYGLWQFYEIAQIDPSLFDSKLLERLESFLQTQKDLKGGFEIRQGLDALGNPEKLVSDMYILFVLSKKHPDLRKLFAPEFEYLVAVYKEFKEKKRTLDSYKLAVLGLLFLNTSNEELAVEIMGVLASRQKSSGEIQNAETSITRSSGTSLDLETTSLTLILALNLKSGDFKPVIDQCLKFISENLKKTYYVSTQATILSLLAIENYLQKFSSSNKGTVTFEIKVNTQTVGKIEVSSSNSLENNICVDLSPELVKFEQASHGLVVKVEPTATSSSGSRYFFDIRHEYYSSLPNSSSKSPLISSITKKDQGEVVLYSIKLRNSVDKEQGMAVIEFNRPACYDFNINDLETLKQKGDIAYYELTENNKAAVFYFRGLKAKETKNIQLSLLKRFTQNTCKERAHSIYLYYDKDGSILYRKAE